MDANAGAVRNVGVGAVSVGVALVGSWRVRGLPGWLIARGYHLLQLPFASRRLRVLSIS